MSALFGVVVRLRNAAFDRGWIATRHLRGPVVSIGNLSVGGAGKTPFLIALGEQIKARNIPFDVLSRGYGRQTKGVREVDPKGASADFGDEPLLIARRLQVPVVVSEERFAAGGHAEKTFGPRLHLLDDGFQHRSLARDLDVVLLTAADLRDRLLPRGRLRESLTSLRRADSVVLMDELDPAVLPADKLIVRARRGVCLSEPASAPVAFCGIARPERFFADLRAAGVAPAAELKFPDHHRYSRGDVHGIFAVRDKYPGSGFVTTEKDLVNLGDMAAELKPLSIARVIMQIDNLDALIDRIAGIVAARLQP